MPRNKYPEQTISKILEVSIKLFSEKGYDHVTIQDIVDQLGGMTKGAIYHHFKGKEEIYEAIIDRLMEADNIFERARKIKGLNGLQRIQWVIVHSMIDDKQLEVNQIAYTVMQTPQFLKKQLQDSVLRQAPYIREFMEEGNRDGSLSVIFPQQAAESFMLHLSIWLNPGVFPYEHNAEKLKHLRLMLDGIGLPVLNDEIMKQMLDFYQQIQK